MRYMILIYGSDELVQTEEEQAAELQRWFDIGEQMQEAGVYVSGGALQPTATATTVRVRNDETLLMDGPFAETKEVLGGFYVIDVAGLDEAIAWAGRMPSATYGSNEIRPLMELLTE